MGGGSRGLVRIWHLHEEQEAGAFKRQLSEASLRSKVKLNINLWRGKAMRGWHPYINGA